MYESHSAVGTPVLTNDSAQNTPQGIGSPFDFQPHRNPHLPGYVTENGNSSLSAGEFGPESLKKWAGQSGSGIPNIPNTFHYIVPGGEEGVESRDSDGLLGRLQGGGGGGQQKKADKSPSVAHFLRDYLVGGSMEVGGAKQGEVGGAKTRGGGSELSLLPSSLNAVPSLPDVATEAVILTPSMIMGEEEGENSVPRLEEFSISRIINRQFSGEDLGPEELLYEDNGFEDHTVEATSTATKKKKPKKPKKPPAVKENSRSRGRPRLTEEEKERRKELRELGLMKRSKRRTKDQVAQWKAEKTMSPAKRGRKRKKNVVKTATGKVMFVSINLSQYSKGTILLQNGFCQAYPGVSKCLDCGTCDGDFPSSKYCRFLEFRKLCVEGDEEVEVSVHGFADYNDVSTQDLVPWTPLRTAGSRMDASTALFILKHAIPVFITILTEEAKTLPDYDVLPIWKRVVAGVRELCDTCDTSLFNFHWVCRSCGFSICPTCYNLAYSSEIKLEDAVSSMEAAVWPDCLSTNQPHRPAGLILTQIIPANALSEVLSQVIAVCEAHQIEVSIPRVMQRLIAVLGHQVPHQKYQNEPSKKSKVQKAITPTHTQLSTGSEYPSNSSSPHIVGVAPQPATTPQSYVPLPTGDTSSSMEISHLCSNGGTEDATAGTDPPPTTPCPHQWLCNGTLLCLLDSKHSENITAFQKQWKRGEPVLVAGVDQALDMDLWTPQAFERDFGDEAADLVDCHQGLHLLQLPSRVFWSGFEDMSVRLRDPSTDQPRLLKLKDWPPGADFSEKLPKRYNDLMSALPLQQYTRREGYYNMASSLPSSFVKPDLGPKMYNAYSSAQYPSSGTTNLHLDISSAVNVMVYCSVPPTEAEKELKLMEEIVTAECCPETLHRVKESGGRVGAIWHLYSSSDVDKLRAFLEKIYEERGCRLQPGSDSIHDQLVYLDSDLRQRLYEEYGVRGWVIAQCLGDALFIPAGAPHQVRNLCSCIKIAEDFVAPEHVYECLKLTDEFRQLSKHHANHEDKLQVKNIIFHSIKDAVGALKPAVK